MANLSLRRAVANITEGIKVDSAAALITAAPVSKFTIVGGNVLMLGFYGEIMIVFPAGACTVAVDANPTVGTTTAIATASADIATYIAGRMAHLPVVGGALTWTAQCGAAATDIAPTYVLRPGTIDVTGSAAPATGTIRWTMWYVPLDDGAYVVGS